jgi:Tfp pilus assembly protein PilO
MKPKQFFFVALGIVAALMGAGGGGYYFGLKQLHKSSNELAVKLAEQQVAEGQIDSLTKLQHQYNRDIVPILPLIDEALPRNKKQTEILAQIQRIAASVGLFVGDVTMPSPQGLPSDLSQTIKAGQVLALPINFEVKGTYPQLQAFTSKLESLNRYTNITTLVVTHDEKSQPLSYAISLNAYIKP